MFNHKTHTSGILQHMSKWLRNTSGLQHANAFEPCKIATDFDVLKKKHWEWLKNIKAV